MKLEKKIEEAKKRIEELKEDSFFDEAEKAESLLRFALFYAQQHKNRLAHYRLEKIFKMIGGEE